MDNDTPITTEPPADLSAESKDGKKDKPKRSALSKGAFDFSMGMAPLAFIAGVAAVAGLLSPFLTSGMVGWVCDLCATFRNQVIILLLLSSLPALFSKPWRIMAIIAIVLALVNVVMVSPFVDSHKVAKGESSYLSFKLVEIRLDTDVVKIDEVAKSALDLDTEIVVITDVDLAKMARLNPKMTGYHNRAEFPDPKGHGVCIYSKIPLKGSRTQALGPDKIPVSIATAAFEYGWVNIVGIRAPEPTDAENYDKRNRFLEAVSKLVAELKGPTIVCGNTNVSPYSGVYGKFLEEGKLKALRDGFAAKPTGYVGPADIFVNRIAIDNFFVNEKVSYLDRTIFADYKGSSYPLIGTFSVSNKDEKYVPPVVAPPPKKAAPKPKAKKQKPKAKAKKKKRRSRKKSRRRK